MRISNIRDENEYEKNKSEMNYLMGIQYTYRNCILDVGG